jgi:hypothetical protein
VAYISNWLTGLVLESCSCDDPKQMTQTSSTRSLKPSWTSQPKPYCVHSLTCCCQEVADQVLQVHLHGLHLPAWQDLHQLHHAVHEGMQGGAAHHCQEELQDCGKAINKKSKVFKLCGAECTPGSWS